MSYAPESGSPEVLKRIKKVVKLDRLASIGRSARSAAGLNVKLNIIMGFPDESAQRARARRCGFWRAWRFAASTT